MAPTTNILISTFPGLSNTKTLAFSLPSTSTTADLFTRISASLPLNLSASKRIILTTTSNKQIFSSDATTLADITTQTNTFDDDDEDGVQDIPTILPLRLSHTLCGGKGGFGSQLRAAGGRMSSRKKRPHDGPSNSSNRNLDGRRLRTVAEAKSLATYLATKPEMERQEKEERRRRWEAVIEMAETREQEMRDGRGGQGRGKGVSDEWVADKEDVADGVKNAVQRAMMARQQSRNTGKESIGSSPEGGSPDRGSASDSSSVRGEQEDRGEEDIMELDDSAMARLRAEAAAGDVDAIYVLKHQIIDNVEDDLTDVLPKGKTKKTDKKGKVEKRFIGFDDDDDDDEEDGFQDSDQSSSNSADEEEEEEETRRKSKGKKPARRKAATGLR